MKKPLIALAAAAILSGCAGHNTRTMDAAELKATSTHELCIAFAHYQPANIRAELETLPEIEHWDWINRKTFGTGMSLTELICSKGLAYDVNTTSGSWGTHKQMVYGMPSRQFKRLYIYLENGVVTSWQN